MYRLMKSQKYTLDHLVSGRMSSYRQFEVTHFQQVLEALGACEAANNEGRFRHYVLNESGQEYYDGTWID
jgi:hypothetical protein